MPRRDNGTRWNSWYEMLELSIERLKQAIIAVTSEESDLTKNIITADEWKTLDHIWDFLQNFYDATKATEGHVLESANRRPRCPQRALVDDIA